jgi:hypothetical protein
MMVHSAKAYMVVFPILVKVELCTTMKKEKKITELESAIKKPRHLK